MKNARLARSLMAMILVVATLVTLCVSAFAASDIYFARYTGNSGSIVTALNSIGADSSYSNRSKIAAANSISGYAGTAAQNTKMLQLLKAGKLIDPVKQAANQSSTQNSGQNGTTYFKKYTGSSGSIVTALNSIGADSSYSNRAKIAAANGISGYSGTAAQNTKMLQLLKAGKLVNPAKTSGSNSGSTNQSTQPTTPSKPSTSTTAAGTHTAVVYNTAGYKMAKTANVKLRTAAKGYASVYATLEKGTLISVTGTVKNFYGLWYKVKLNGGVYYVLQTQLTAAGSQTTANLVRVTKNAALRNAPYDTGASRQVQAGTILHTVGTYTNKHGNRWYVVKLQNDSALYYIYSGNVAKSYNTSGSIYLDVKTQFQTTNYTCSAAAAQAVLRYYNTALNVADTTLYSSTGGVVYKTTNTVNQYLGQTYRHNTFYSVSAYEKAIRDSLAQGSPVIARVKFSKGYFNYSSGGHYTTIVGIYTDNGGKTWLKLADSFVNRYSSNSYSNAQTGVVYVPLATMYQYGKYNGASDVYLIYND